MNKILVELKVFVGSRKESLSKNSPAEAFSNCGNKNEHRECVVTESPRDIDQQLIMAINLPDDVKGSEVKVSIQLKAIGKSTSSESAKTCSPSGTTLEIKDSTPDHSTYSGNIRVPSCTTIEQVSKMPLYFLGSTELSKQESKIETIIQPMENNLPPDLDGNMLIDEIDLSVNFENISKPKMFKMKSLSCTFIYSKTTLRPLSLPSLGNILAKSSEILDQITTQNQYGEASKMTVKEILQEVLSKVHLRKTFVDASSSKLFVECVSKEIDVQKSLLLEKELFPSESTQLDNSISKNNRMGLMPQIQEEMHDSNNSQGNDGNVNSSFDKAAENDLVPLCVPSNTPSTFRPTKYLLKYDANEQIINDNSPSEPEINLLSILPKINQLDAKTYEMIRKDLKADIDKTLELLESVKGKLINYLCHQEQPCLSLDGDIRITNRHQTVFPEENAFNLIPFETATRDREEYEKEQIRNDEKKNDRSQFFLGLSIAKTQSDLQLLQHSNTIIANQNEDASGPILTAKIESDNDKILRKRYNGRSPDTKLSVVQNDIDIMIKELLLETSLMKDSISQNLDVRCDVEQVLDKLIDNVASENSSAQNQQKVAKAKSYDKVVINPVYYCLFQQNPIAKQCLVPKSKLIKKFGKTNFSEGLHEKLEIGASFIADLYKEIYVSFQHSTVGGKQLNKIDQRVAIRASNIDSHPKIKPSEKIPLLKPQRLSLQSLKSNTEVLEQVIDPIEEVRPPSVKKSVKNLCDILSLCHYSKGHKNCTRSKGESSKKIENQTKCSELKNLPKKKGLEAKGPKVSNSKKNVQEPMKESNFDAANHKTKEDQSGSLTQLLGASVIIQNQLFTSEQQFSNYIFDCDEKSKERINAKYPINISDVPHAFVSSQQMVQYTNNLRVLQDRLRGQKVTFNEDNEPSSDSDITVVQLKELSQAIVDSGQIGLCPSLNLGTLGESIAGKSSISQSETATLGSSNYDADLDDYDAPKIRTQIVRSVQELNNVDEIIEIEHNVSTNNLLRMRNKRRRSSRLSSTLENLGSEIGVVGSSMTSSQDSESMESSILSQ